MAKHKAGKSVSKGLRISCHGNKRHACKPVGGNMNNAMREAMLNTNFSDSVRYSRLGAIMIRTLQAPVKLSQEQAKGWSTKLSFRTFKALQEQGVL